MTAETSTSLFLKIGRLPYDAARGALQRFRTKPRIFVSHSASEGTAARAALMRLVDELTQEYDVLFDRTALGAGNDWRDMVDRWIRECDAALVLITPEALASSYSRHEWAVLSFRRKAENAFLVIPVYFGSAPDDLKDDPFGIGEVAGYFGFGAVDDIIPDLRARLAAVRERPPPLIDRIGSAVAILNGALQRFLKYLSGFAKGESEKRPEPEPEPSQFASRPPGWTGHWSVRYGEVLARTLKVYPPYWPRQQELLAAIPRPLQEALDPVASPAEPTDRDGNLLRWRLTRSAVLDFFGPLGLIVGALSLGIAALWIAIPLAGLPPLTAPAGSPPQLQQQQPPADKKG